MSCEKCKDGLIPFVKDGKVIKHAFVHCACYEEPPEKYHRITPDDMDFPCSDTFRAYSFEQYIGDDPAKQTSTPVNISSQPQVIEHIHRHADMSSKDFAKLQQLIGEVKYLREKKAEKDVGW